MGGKIEPRKAAGSLRVQLAIQGHRVEGSKNDLQNVTFSILFKLYIVGGLGVLITKRYHILGYDQAKWVKKGKNYC